MDRGLTYNKIDGMMDSLCSCTSISVKGLYGTIETYGINKEKIRDLDQTVDPEDRFEDNILEISNSKYRIAFGEIENLSDDYINVALPETVVLYFIREIRARAQFPMGWVSPYEFNNLPPVVEVAIYRPKAVGWVWKYKPSRETGGFIITRLPVFEDGFSYGEPIFNEEHTYIPHYVDGRIYEFLMYENAHAESAAGRPDRIIYDREEVEALKERL